MFICLSLPKFIRKTKEVFEMGRVSEQLSHITENLEIRYNISRVLFNKYSELFWDIFKCFNLNYISVLVDFDNEHSACTSQLSTRSWIRTTENLNFKEMFRFGWLLFILIKSKKFIFKYLIKFYRLKKIIFLYY